MKRLSFIWFCFRTLESLQFKKSSFSLVPVLYLKTLIVPCQLWSSFVWIIFLQFWLFLSLQGEPILRQLWLHRVLEIGRCQRFGMSAMSRGKYGKKGFFYKPKDLMLISKFVQRMKSVKCNRVNSRIFGEAKYLGPYFSINVLRHLGTKAKLYETS